MKSTSQVNTSNFVSVKNELLKFSNNLDPFHLGTEENTQRLMTDPENFISKSGSQL